MLITIDPKDCKTIPVPRLSFPKRENSVGFIVIEILRFRQKKPYYLDIFFSWSMRKQWTVNYTKFYKHVLALVGL